ncbi:hypothetical protein TeGR_g1804 [Tetraparma gracilis]|uniref:Acyltransferase n=1 Tax=Tetraparma gracilis TaxID=2962635 RepID=A0ABQ6ME34_9STRA|nr:hypothetical protein TeGR_g1804 [Tetraparma gracilis]
MLPTLPIAALLAAPPTLAFLYVIWCVRTHRYCVDCRHVPWRRAFLSVAMFWDVFVWETLFGLRRRLHFSLCPRSNRSADLRSLEKYRTDFSKSSGTMWTACPHHLLLPSFFFAFHCEAAGVHAAMGVSLDDIFTAAATVLFYIPVVREVVITLGGRIASPNVLAKMKMFALAPGGVHEMIRQSDDVDRVFLRTGFIRFALKKKLDINVIYLFDENTCYKPISNLPAPLVAFQRWVHRNLGAGLCIWRGRWGVPFNLVPYPGDYTVGVGRPIPIALADGMEEDAAIEFLMEKYIAELRRLFKELQEDTGRRKNVKLEVERLQTRRTRVKSADGVDGKKRK